MRTPLRLVDARPALSEIDASAAEAWAVELGLPKFRGRQVAAALDRRAVQSHEELTDLPTDLRARLTERYRVRTLDVRVHLRSKEDESEKVLFGLRDGAAIETVLIRGRNASGAARETVCVSSQVGCPAGCTFCATGLAGFGRNLTSAEIVDQVMHFSAQMRAEGRRVSNVVFMGMGEPLLNPAAVRQAIERLTSPVGLNLGARGITVSTVGIVPQIRRFTEWGGQVNLAVSLHAPNDALRETLVPYNRHFPVAEIMSAVREYLERTHRRVSFEYVLLAGTNDAPELAEELARLLRPLGGGAHVNLIPWNPFREGKFIRSEGPNADGFADILRQAGVNATIRYSKGLDISAACAVSYENVKRPPWPRAP
jgi:23S rRNA (adenine2503-C2)-methyltransferase